MTDIDREQEQICARLGIRPVDAPQHLKVGLARNVGQGLWPLNGLRHPPQGDTTGWYIWAGGEPSDVPDFFEPVHLSHLTSLCPEILKFLRLPPGWRFLYAPGQEDVWQDSGLLSI